MRSAANTIHGRDAHGDETRTGDLFGLTDAHTRDDTVFAVREGVAFVLRRCVEVLLELGIPVDPIVVTGGRSADAELMQTLADVLGRPVATAGERTPSMYGAAGSDIRTSMTGLPTGTRCASSCIKTAARRHGDLGTWR